MKKIFMICVILITCSSCTEFALLASGSSIAISQNSYAKMYNGVDILTIMGTDKSIKRHAYDNTKKALIGLKKGKKYIYDGTIELFGNKH
tara:strand:+ start:325 stop:594 length:270 start_codon:yes stop_codon:yes gene_type:complete